MNEELNDKRLGDLEDNIRQGMDLLKGYEDELRHETDPRRLARYRSEIERQRESLAQYQQEYDELKKHVPSAQMQNVTNLLQQQYTKLDDIKKLLPPIWNVPYHHNPNFIGRVDILSNLRLSLTSGEPTAWKQAITGMGGVGKTQLAVQYIYLHKTDYNVIWWIRCEEVVVMDADYADLAVSLYLPEKDSPDQTEITTAVKRWLEHHSGWLLIFDNAQDPEEIRNYLPRGGAGHLIITSRNIDWGGAAKLLPVRIFDRADSVDFLCKRAWQDDTKAADALADELGDLPLALEQAGAYIETTGIMLTDYQELFQSRRKELWDDETPPPDYHSLVATTWSLAMEQVSKESHVAADLLNLCAFLASDGISLEMLSKGAEHLPEPLAATAIDRLAMNRAKKVLMRYSLVEVTGNALSVHRLVQTVIRDRIAENNRKVWIEAALHILCDAFPIKSDDPESIDIQTLVDCSCLLPHALSASKHAEILEVALGLVSNLLNQAGSYLRERADLYEAKELHERALKIAEAFYHKKHPDVAICLENLGRVLRDQGNLEDAKNQLERALKIDEASYGSEHPHVAICVDNLGRVLDNMGKLTAAKEHFERALKIDEVNYGPNHFKVAIRLNNLGSVIQNQGNLEVAKYHYEKALEIDMAFYSKNHPYVAIRLNNLGSVLQDMGDLQGAKEHYEKALKIDKAFYGPESPHVAICVNNLGSVLQDLGNLPEAKQHFKRALKIDEITFGPDHHRVANDVNNFGLVLRAQGDLQGAKQNFERALKIGEKTYGFDHPNVAMIVNNLGIVLRVLGDLQASKEHFKRALKIDENTYGSEHPNVARDINNLGLILQDMRDLQGAKEHLERALKIDENTYGPDHPNVARDITNLGCVLRAQ